MVSLGECSRVVPLSLTPIHNRLAVHEPSPTKATWSLDFKISEQDKAGEKDLIVEGDDSRLDEKVRSMEAGDPRTLDKATTLASKKKDSMRKLLLYQQIH
ncbi:hypothetical protein GOP47_0022030 [Adiantum capillus-veneris]|uniref:Uncharacterized protein n=1 Tax=Adiantum capillus-veneris TaxID=13818 RepID=A0A9D4U9I3_ADICA|nr:hypothetical protein GOP47_0022030 [Adiantum capillus-veneris]